MLWTDGKRDCTEQSQLSLFHFAIYNTLQELVDNIHLTDKRCFDSFMSIHQTAFWSSWWLVLFLAATSASNTHSILQSKERWKNIFAPEKHQPSFVYSYTAPVNRIEPIICRGKTDVDYCPQFSLGQCIHWRHTLPSIGINRDLLWGSLSRHTVLVPESIPKTFGSAGLSATNDYVIGWYYDNIQIIIWLGVRNSVYWIWNI